MSTKNMQHSGKQTILKNTSKTYSNNNQLVKKNILGVEVTSASPDTILEFIVKSLQNSSKPYYVVTPNPEMVVLASKNPEFKGVLNNAKLASNDGVGIGLAAGILGISLNERFTGVELMKKLCERVNDWPITVGFLGGGLHVAELTAECLTREYPNLKVAFAGEEWPDGSFGKKPKTQKLTTNYKLQTTLHVDILFVAFGAPKQEFWMAQHVGKIDVKIMIGVGGAFDYMSGKIPRAPKLVRSFGMEWLFRLFVQPWRIKRQLALLEFMWMVVKEKFKFAPQA